MSHFHLENNAIKQAVYFLEPWLEYRVRQDSLPGLSIAILARGKTILSRAYGVTGESFPAILLPEHLFSMASQTKMLTAALIMQAAENGKLGLDDKAVKYISWLNRHADSRVGAITLRHLLMHGSGLLRDGGQAIHWLGAPAPSQQQLRQMVLGHPLTFPPGEGVKYSNVGYALLGMILETAEANTYKQLVHKLLEDLQIEGYIDPEPEIQKRIVRGYGIPMRGVREPFLKPSQLLVMDPAAGLFTTPLAMSRLVHELFVGTAIMSEASQKQMSTTQNKVIDGYDEGTEFGLGIEYQDVNGNRTVGHTGHTMGHVSASLCDPSRQLVVSVAANAKDTPTTSIARGVMGALQYFIDASRYGNAEYSARFNARLGNKMSTVQIVDALGKIVMVDPDDWEPFEWYEELERIDDTTLRCVTKNSVYNGGELIKYQFEKSRLVYATVAGFPFKSI